MATKTAITTPAPATTKAKKATAAPTDTVQPSFMDNVWFEMGMSVVFTAIRQAFASPAKRDALKRTLLKIRNQINLLYANDPDFAA